MQSQRLNQVMQDLIQFQSESAAYELLQFRSLVGACQFLRLYQLWDRYVAKGASVLDWGCGNGHFSYFLMRSGYQVSGFALSDFPLRLQLQQLSSQFPYTFKQGDPGEPTRLPYAEGEFDAVVSVGVLEHVRETGGTELGSLQEIHRILALDGYFICYHLPNQWGVIDSLAALIPNKYHHPYRYTRRSIEALCQQAGLTIVAMHRYGALPRNLWGALPKPLRNAPWVARIWNGSDEILQYPFSLICQNYFFVAQKRSRL
ncbi:hypothetical protein BST81_21140 [Leptolyngbya sp. 'hensonii']|uniref:class I SAM-dependent methyltransferase n=1 Tax=Leptolyngbya sp. 'hensonii' TaxID=1922337 RepID=UPI00094FE7A7|nr:class I SAM-dependent methyltransferase [Leptolyngbya sp. 'hensonii']OLP16486.1 hypothetical protein BST81_21140 [Leptolyngbya sp. 'hensonii']